MAKNQRPFRGQKEVELSSQPFKSALKGMKAGPLCLKCNDTMDTRESYSVSNPRGSRKLQRHGFLHEECMVEAEKKYHEEEWKPGEKPGTYLKFVKRSVGMELPVFTDAEITTLLNGEE